jgi:hypothetical protein
MRWPLRRVIGALACFSGGEIPGATTYRTDSKSPIVFALSSEHQIFRKEAGIPDVPGGSVA